MKNIQTEDKTASSLREYERRPAKESLKLLLPFISNHTVLIIISVATTILATITSIAIGFVIRATIDGFPESNAEAVAFLNKAFITAIAILLFYGLVQYIQNLCVLIVAAKVSQDIRCKIFNNILHQNLEYIDNQSSGDMQTRIIADTNEVGAFLSVQLPSLSSGLLTGIGGIIGAFLVNSSLTIIVLCGIPFVFLPFILFAKRLQSRGNKMQTSIAKLGEYAGEVFRNIKMVKAYNKEFETNTRFYKKARNITKNIQKTRHAQIAINTVVRTLIFLGFVSLLWFAAQEILEGTMTIGQLASFGYFAVLIISSTAIFISLVSSLHVVLGTTEKISDYLKISPVVENSSNIVTDGDSIKLISTIDIEFKNVSFSYPTRPQILALNGINLSITSGSEIAIVGRSGAGKSTLFELLLKFYKPNSGEILINGTNINDIDSLYLRSLISYVPQKESLITGTVYENIAYGSDTASSETVIQSAKLALADIFTDELPQGYDTKLGEISNRLSGGQKQRLALARAFIREPKLLILDESNNALDTVTERAISQNIKEWAKQRNMTVLSATHRLSTVINSDSIIVMDKGKIVSQGKHAELLETCPVYKKLASDTLKDDPIPSIDDND